MKQHLKRKKHVANTRLANRYRNWTILVTMIAITDQPKNPVWCIFGFDQLETPPLDVKLGKLDSKLVQKSIGMGPAQCKTKMVTATQPILRIMT